MDVFRGAGSPEAERGRTARARWRRIMRVKMCVACEGTRGTGTRGLPHGSDLTKGLIGICSICHGSSSGSCAYEEL